MDGYWSSVTVENAASYTRPEKPPPIYVTGFGPKAGLAGWISDGATNIAGFFDYYRDEVLPRLREKCRMTGNKCRMTGNKCRMAGNKCRMGEK